MKNIWKSVLSLSCISVVCAVLIILGSIYLPKQERTFDFGEYLGDSTAVFEELKISEIDSPYLTDITAVFEATGGTAAGGYVIKSKAIVPQYGSVLEFITGIDKNTKIVKVGYVGALVESNFFNYALTESNFEKFVGIDPNTIDATSADDVKGNFATSGATFTAQAMVAAVQNAFNLARDLQGGETPTPPPVDPNVNAVKGYFAQTVVSAAVNETASTNQIKVYDVVLEGDVKAWAFVDTHAYYQYTVTLPDSDGIHTGEIILDADGSFKVTSVGIGVYQDGADVKYAKLSTTGTTGSVGYFNAKATALDGVAFGKVTVADFEDVIASEGGFDIGNSAVSGATASGVAAVKYVNRMYTDYMKDYVETAVGGV